MFKWLVSYKKEWIAGCAAALLYSGADLVFPWGTKLIFDEVIHQKKTDWIPWVLSGLGIALFLRFAFAYLKTISAHRLSEKAAVDLRGQLNQTFFSLNAPEVEKISSAKLLNIFVSDIDCLKRFYFESLNQFFFSGLYIAVILGFLFWLNPVLAVISALLLPVSAYLFFFVRQGERKDLHQLKENNGLWMGRFQEAVQLFKTVVLSNKQKHEQNRFMYLWKKGFHYSMGMNRRSSLFLALGEGMASFSLILLLCAGAWGVMQEWLSMGELLAFYIAFSYLFLPVGKMVSLREQFKEAQVSMKRIDAFLGQNIKTELVHKENLRQWCGSVEFKNVTFAFESGEAVLRNLNVKIQNGEKVALVGRSGAGKTTLLYLLCGFYQPVHGDILIGTQPLKKINLKSYYSQLGGVFQAEPLWSATIKENILYGTEFNLKNDIPELIEKVALTPLLRQLSDKGETRIGEGGVQLSIGEQKRIALARSFRKNPKLYLFDEAAAALDSESEKQIQESLRSLTDAACLIVAHRLSTVWQADTVWVLDKGEIVEQGSPTSLLEPGTVFYDLFRHQIKQFHSPSSI